MSLQVHEAPAVIFIQQLLEKAITVGASDIHIESCKDRLRVRLRVDGLLYDDSSIMQEYAAQSIARVKVLARLDVSERRIPQDGKFFIALNSQTIDLRVSTFPALHGEKIVIRILDTAGALLDINHIGLTQPMLKVIKKLITKAHGFFLVTGPTGSGKTTTLYALLHAVISSEKNIVTLEDPIEYTIEGITQSQVQSEIGFTFARGIRSLVRQDPDVIMVGEIRDTETAQVAIQAALTGHLVLSTLHTADAPSTLLRLLDMDIEPFLLNSALTAVLTQRLARKICTSCRIEVAMTNEQAELIKRYDLPITQCFKGTGCRYCYGVGSKGRIGIFELLVISHALRALMTSKPDFADLYKQALDDNMIPMLLDGASKVQDGIISFEELMRIML